MTGVRIQWANPGKPEESFIFQAHLNSLQQKLFFAKLMA